MSRFMSTTPTCPCGYIYCGRRNEAPRRGAGKHPKLMPYDIAHPDFSIYAHDWSRPTVEMVVDQINEPPFEGWTSDERAARDARLWADIERAPAPFVAAVHAALTPAILAA